jgi:hypothetical protein
MRMTNDTNETFRISASFASGQSATSAISISHLGARGFGLLVPSGTPYCDIGVEVSASGFPNWAAVADGGNSTVKWSGISAVTSNRLLLGSTDFWAVGAMPAMRLVTYSGGAQTLRTLDTGLTFTLVAVF